MADSALSEVSSLQAEMEFSLSPSPENGNRGSNPKLATRNSQLRSNPSSFSICSFERMGFESPVFNSSANSNSMALPNSVAGDGGHLRSQDARMQQRANSVGALSSSRTRLLGMPRSLRSGAQLMGSGGPFGSLRRGSGSSCRVNVEGEASDMSKRDLSVMSSLHYSVVRELDQKRVSTKAYRDQNGSLCQRLKDAKDTIEDMKVARSVSLHCFLCLLFRHFIVFCPWNISVSCFRNSFVFALGIYVFLHSVFRKGSRIAVGCVRISTAYRRR